MAGIGNTEIVLSALTLSKQLTRDQQLADRIDRCGFLLEQVIIQAAGIAGAVVIPAADSVYVDSAGKAFGPIT